ncbi:MAG: apolipoprotein N-acyltransferase [Mariniphaga sp.]
MSRIFRIFLSVLSGILLSLAWLGLPGWTLFIAFIPLLLLDAYFVERKHEYSEVTFWWHTLLAFLIWNTLTTWWISWATLPGAILAIIANSLLMSLVWWLGHIARRRFKSTLGYVALVVFWISFEYFHFHWDIEWPWLNLGNGFANDIKMVQWYEYTGVLGGTLWVWIMNILLFRIFQGFSTGKRLNKELIPVVTVCLLLIVPVSLSLLLYHSYTEKKNPLHVVIVQPNIDPYQEEYDIQSENRKLQRFIQLAEQEISEKTDLVLGPETIFERYPDWNTERLEYNFQFQQIQEWMRQHPRMEVIFGSSTSRVYPDPGQATATSRISNGLHYDVFNSAVFIDHKGNGYVYHKSILVPGVEKMPFRNYMGFLNDVVIDLGGTTGSLGRQDEPANFSLKNQFEVAPVICYESVFGGYLAEFVRKGAQLIVVITNDGWWRDTPGYRQHLSFSRLRAVETRRSIARSANTGISCFVNQRGDIIHASNWWEESALAGTVQLNDEITFYVKYGDYIGRISRLMAVLLLLFTGVKRWVKE